MTKMADMEIYITPLDNKETGKLSHVELQQGSDIITVTKESLLQFSTEILAIIGQNDIE